MIVLASLCCDAVIAEPQLTVGQLHAAGQIRPRVVSGHVATQREKWEGNPEMPTFYLSSVTALSFFCLLFDYKQYTLWASCPQESPKSSVELQNAVLGLVKMTKLGSSHWRRSRASPRVVGVNLQWEMDAVVQHSLLCSFFHMLKLGIKTKQKYQILQSYSYLLNNIFHSFLLPSS